MSQHMKNAGAEVNRNIEYTVITEKMLGSWLPQCNDLYDIIYGGIVAEYSVRSGLLT